MNIPGDTGHPWRLNKFVEYQHKASSCGPPFLASYAREGGLSPAEVKSLCWFNSAVYSEITACLLFAQRDAVRGDPDGFWRANKSRLIFGSARKHAKNMDWFPDLVRDEPELTGKNSAELYKQLRAVRYVGRFAADKFLESYHFMAQKGLIPLRLEAEGLDWKNGDNFTSGLLNIFYRDEEADAFDATGKLTTAVQPLAEEAMAAVRARYPDQESLDMIVVLSKACSFRNLFKGRRYGGFHHDRQMEQLKAYETTWPGQVELWDELWRLRRQTYSPTLLGEIGGWAGVRKERSKLWLTKGLTGVEEL